MRLSFRHYYFRWTKNLLCLFVLFAILMTLARTAFALYFGDVETLTSDLGILGSAMLLGLRYDLMPLAYIVALPFLILNLAYIVPGKVTIKAARFLIISILSLGLVALIWVYVLDYAFYSYFQDHINVLFFGLFEDDTVAVVISAWKNYNVPLWFAVIFFTHYVLYRFIKFLFSPFEFDLKVRTRFWHMPLILILGLVALAWCGRGNFGRLPLSIEDAHISSNDFVNKLPLNGAICLNRTIKIRKVFGKGNHNYLAQYKYNTWKDAFADVRGTNPSAETLKASFKARVPRNPVVEKNPPHVVMVVMESFGSYWNERDGKNFNLLGALKGHFAQGMLFKNFLPAENGTIGSIVSVTTAQPIRPGARFLSESEYMATPLSSAGHLPFKKKGYTTHFVYGGKLGWRALGKFLAVQGFDKLWGADEMKESMPELTQIPDHELGNEWGIFDEYLYAFIEDQLRTAVGPQFFLVLTTSNHPPFEYPTSYKPLPIELSQKTLEQLTVREDLARRRFEALQYSNQKMGEFLTRVRTSTLKDEAVVALTGDHSFWIKKGVGSDEEFRRYSVPFFISAPERLRPQNADLSRFGSHEDIFPTLYHLTLSDVDYVKLGENLLGEDSIAVNSTGLVANKSGAFHHNSYWTWKTDGSLRLEPAKETPELLRLKKHYQGLIGITDAYLREEKAGTSSAAEGGPR